LAREYSTFGDLERHDRGMATQHERHMYYTIQESVEFIKYRSGKELAKKKRQPTRAKNPRKAGNFEYVILDRKICYTVKRLLKKAPGSTNTFPSRASQHSNCKHSWQKSVLCPIPDQRRIVLLPSCACVPSIPFPLKGIQLIIETIANRIC
jgi:hypothetical protein